MLRLIIIWTMKNLLSSKPEHPNFDVKSEFWKFRFFFFLQKCLLVYVLNQPGYISSIYIIDKEQLNRLHEAKVVTRTRQWNLSKRNWLSSSIMTTTNSQSCDFCWKNCEVFHYPKNKTSKPMMETCEHLMADHTHIFWRGKRVLGLMGYILKSM